MLLDAVQETCTDPLAGLTTTLLGAVGTVSGTMPFSATELAELPAALVATT